MKLTPEMKMGFLKAANEAGLSEEQALAMLEGAPQDPAQILEQAAPENAGLPMERTETGLPTGEGEEEVPELSDEDIDALAEAIAEELIEETGEAEGGEQEMVEAKVASANYIGGFLKQAKYSGFNANESLQLFKVAYDSSFVAAEQQKQAEEYLIGVFEKAAEYGLNQEQTINLLEGVFGSTQKKTASINKQAVLPRSIAAGKTLLAGTAPAMERAAASETAKVLRSALGEGKKGVDNRMLKLLGSVLGGVGLGAGAHKAGLRLGPDGDKILNDAMSAAKQVKEQAVDSTKDNYVQSYLEKLRKGDMPTVGGTMAAASLPPIFGLLGSYSGRRAAEEEDDD